MGRQSCGGSADRKGSKRAVDQMPDIKNEPAAKQARKPATPQGQAEELMSFAVLEFLKKNGVTKASVEPVLEVVRHALSSLPQEASDLLLATLPWSLGVPVNKRRESQQDVVLMMGGVYEHVQAELQRALDVEASKVNEMRVAQAELASAAERAETASVEARSAVEDQEKTLAQASSTLVEAGKVAEAAEREGARLLAEVSQTRSLKLELKEALSGSFMRCKGLEFEDGEVDSLMQTVLAAAAKCCMEEALVTTLPISLSKRERRPFDQQVICAAEDCIQGKITALGEAVEAATAADEAQAQVAREAREVADAAAGDEAQALQELSKRQAEACEAAAQAGAGRVAATEFDTKLAPALEVQGVRQGELDHFRSYNVFLFELLRDRTTKDVAKESAGAVGGAVLPASLAGA